MTVAWRTARDDAVDFPSTCPHCGYDHDCATGLFSADVPDEGDVSICIRCGQLCWFQRSAPGGLRKPTKKEKRELLRDDKVIRALAAWRQVKQ
jgi:hypothetical protein